MVSIFLLALVFRGPGLAQANCYCLFRVLHLFPATGFEFPMFELVHDATDRFLLGLGLVSCHRLTSRFSIILMIAGRPVLVPVFKALTPPILARNSANRTGSSGCCHRN